MDGFILGGEVQLYNVCTQIDILKVENAHLGGLKNKVFTVYWDVLSSGGGNREVSLSGVFSF